MDGSISRRQVMLGLLSVSCARASRGSATSIRTGPPLWRVNGGASRVFLFGQMPIPKGIDWLKPEIEAAFDESDEVWFENPDFDPSTAGPAIQKRIALGGPKLGATISEPDRQRLGDALQKAGRPPEALDGQLVWESYLAVSDLVDALSGVDPASLPERLLKPRAKASGKTIHSEWSSMEEIMEFSSEHTLEQQLQLIGKTLDEVKSTHEVQRLAEAWASGDISEAEAQDRNFRSRYPELSTRLVSERNREWALRVADMLERNKSTFVCVGLGHLVGPESIQSYVAGRGLKTLRV